MEYTKTEWQDGAVALSAEHMNNIENGIDDAKNEINSMFSKQALFDAIYPVGSIYMSVNNVNPGVLFGGTWEAWGQGRVPVGVGTSDREFGANESGGSSDAVVVSHDHTATFSGNAVGSHTHTGPNHVHTMAHTHTGPNHTHTMAHTHTGPSHTHGSAGGGWFAVGKGTRNSVRKAEPGSRGWVATATDGWQAEYSTAAAGTGTTSGSSAANTGYAGTGSTGASSAANTGYAGTGATGAAGSHTPSGTVSVASKGVSGTDKNLQPYITCYMWKRVADPA